MDSLAQLPRALLACDVDQASGHDLSYLAFSDVFIEPRGNKLFHAQPNLSLLLIHVKDLRLHDLAGAKHVLRPFNPLLRADLADVDHALNPFSKLHERAELREA